MTVSKQPGIKTFDEKGTWETVIGSPHMMGSAMWTCGPYAVSHLHSQMRTAAQSHPHLTHEVAVSTI